ncbi:unnamed protein product [Calypogeia fissa]
MQELHHPHHHIPTKGNEVDNRRVLLAITVEIEDGCVEHIEMREGDSAEAVATKFCRDHSLPDQFVAPLTEHIVSNIVSLSTEDEEAMFSGNMEKSNDSWEQQQSAPQNDASGSCSPTQHHGYTSDQENRVARCCGCKQKKSPGGGVHGGQGGQENCMPNGTLGKKQMKTMRRLSERLLAPTLTSLAKRPQAPEKDKNKELESIAQRPISERAKAVYMRLYAEFLRQKQRIEVEKARNLEMYQEKIDRDRACVSKRSWRVWRLRGRTAKQYRNYGELLYSEGLNKKEQLKQLIVKKQQEDELKELRELTLKPEISKRAKQIRRDQGKIWQRLQTPDRPRQEQLQELRNEIWEAKLMECTFKPQINPRRYSEKILHDGKDSSTSRFDQLFLDAENRRRRQAEYMQWYPEGVTFQPRINRQRQSNGLDIDDEYHQERTVFDRLLHYASKSIEKKQMSQQIASKPIDPATGQELFTPVTGRKPIYDRNTSDLPIGEFLYQLKDSMERKKQWLARRELQIRRNQASCHYVGSKSQKLLDGIQERRFQEIFNYLDKDKDGYLGLETADLNELADDVAEDVARLKEMAGGKMISFRSFADSMKIIQEQTHKPSTVHMVVKHKRHDSPVHLQFKMDRYSRNLACRRRRFSSSRQWYKLLLADRAKWQVEMEAMRKERQSMEMKECTFRPEIQKKRSLMKVSHLCNEQLYHPPATYSPSNIVEKQQQEMHGFIFQEENSGDFPERFQNATDSASCGINHGESLSHVDDLNPLGLIESLKSLKQIVAQSDESKDERPPQVSPKEDFRQDFTYEPLYKQKVGVQNLDVSTVSDLPEKEGKEGLFMGLMGA